MIKTDHQLTTETVVTHRHVLELVAFAVLLCCALNGCIIPIDHDIPMPIAFEASSGDVSIYSFDPPVRHVVQIHLKCKESDRPRGLPDVFRSGSPDQWLWIMGRMDYWQNGKLILTETVTHLSAGGLGWGLGGMHAMSKGRITMVVSGDLARLIKGRQLDCTYFSAFTPKDYRPPTRICDGIANQPSEATR